MRIALLGATGHVGRVLTAGLGARPDVELVLLARDPERAARFAAERVTEALWRTVSLDETPAVRVDAFINCLGAGDPGRLPGDLLELEASFDALFLGGLEANEGARGIAFSSGVIYDSDFAEPAGDTTPVRLEHAPAGGPGDAYSIAKARAEAAHRARPETAIADLRLFGLYSRYIDRSARYLVNDIVNAIEAGASLTVSPDDIVRDYVAPTDLVALVGCVLDAAPVNAGIDVYSTAPVSKRELLAHLGESRGLTYTEAPQEPSPTGVKPNYFSTSRVAESLGYRPTRTSLEALSEEIDAMLEPLEGGAR